MGEIKGKDFEDYKAELIRSKYVYIPMSMEFRKAIIEEKQKRSEISKDKVIPR